MGGGAALEASKAAMGMLDQTAAQTTLMNAKASSEKMVTDTINGIADGYVDSATKASNAATSSAKSISF
ncbi:ATP-dependent helicase HrpA [Billgrantia tianxiuensis]|uniref:ATP-dependent helicase HrpA n=1 Tax=Billgrantia tianxiuensis TaxID=2497861 RepID=A0A6I6SVG6_9GAMM|nr:ATP-dependent helicase HrpA [Halomonas sp. MCCC 1A11057]QHC52095.1 ATP-dependent helicase HrpA [Halomonas tianxiuensis]